MHPHTLYKVLVVIWALGAILHRFLQFTVLSTRTILDSSHLSHFFIKTDILMVYSTLSLVRTSQATRYREGHFIHNFSLQKFVSVILFGEAPLLNVFDIVLLALFRTKKVLVCRVKSITKILPSHQILSSIRLSLKLS